MASGQLGSFHHEYLVTTHTYTEKWPIWEMHPHGDEVVLLISGAVDVLLEEAAGARIVSLRAPGDCVLVPQGAWHTATPLGLSTLLFITAGEGTQHRPAS
jgi:mannose-6-phosphate isomerase-like protein (cupin superfamily)